MKTLNSAVVVGRICGTPFCKTTASGSMKIEFTIKSPTRLGEIRLLVVGLGNIAKNFELTDGQWAIFSGSLDATFQDPLVRDEDRITFALILRDYSPIVIPQAEIEIEQAVPAQEQ